MHLQPEQNIEDQIANFIAKRGVTRGPAVACVPTTATIPEADLIAIRLRGDVTDIPDGAKQALSFKLAMLRRKEQRRNVRPNSKGL